MTWLQPFPDALLARIPADTPGPEARYAARQAIELAFIAGLQRLPPRQLAVLVLRDVLGFPADETAAMLGTTRPAVKASLQRARASLGARPGSAGTLPSAADEDVAARALARRFADAFAADDIDAVVKLVTDDAWLAMPPAPHEYQGAAAVGRFLRASADWRSGRRFRLLPARANGQPAFGCYLDSPGGTSAEATGLLAVSVAGGRITAITRFLLPAILPRFGLPLILPPD